MQAAKTALDAFSPSFQRDTSSYGFFLQLKLAMGCRSRLEKCPDVMLKPVVLVMQGTWISLLVNLVNYFSRDIHNYFISNTGIKL